jgi:hypothetical protein
VTLLAASWAASVLLVRSPGGFEKMAFYSAADRLRSLQVYIVGFLGTALLPAIAGQASAHHQQRTSDIGVRISALVVVPVSVCLGYVGPAMMKLFGDSYAAQSLVILPTIAWGGVAALSSTVAVIAYAYGRTRETAAAQLAGAAVLVLFARYSVTFGAPGLAGAQYASASVVFAFLVLSGYLQRWLPSRAVHSCVCSWLLCLVLLGPSLLMPAAWHLWLTPPMVLLAIVASIALFTGRDERESALKYVRGLGGILRFYSRSWVTSEHE